MLLFHFQIIQYKEELLDISKNADKKLQNSNFALIGDESTDISNESQLLAFLYFTDEK